MAMERARITSLIARAPQTQNLHSQKKDHAPPSASLDSGSDSSAGGGFDWSKYMGGGTVGKGAGGFDWQVHCFFFFFIHPLLLLRIVFLLQLHRNIREVGLALVLEALTGR